MSAEQVPRSLSKIDTSTETTEQFGTVTLFGRSDSGMIIGLVQNDGAKFGEDPAQAIARTFLSREEALEWLKGKCREYCGREDVEFFERPKEKQEERRIMVPPGPMPRRRM